MKKEIIFMLLIAAMLIIAGISMALAQENDSDNLTTNETENGNQVPENETAIAKNWTKDCDKINEVVSKKLELFNEGHVRRINAYNNTEVMVQKLINNLKAKGADTSTAEADYLILQEKVNQFVTDYSAFITKLKSLQAYTCGNSSGAFVAELKEIKKMLPTLRNESAQIREAAKDVKNDLVQIRTDLLVSKLGEKANKTANAEGLANRGKNK